MMDELPPLRDGYLRLTVALQHAMTPGALAKACGVALEELGPVVVGHGQAAIDVRLAAAGAARDALTAAVGPVQVGERPRSRLEHGWCWMRLGLGRNHGLNLGRLRKLLDAAEVRPVGRIKLNNTHTVVGVPADDYERIVAAINATRVNGYPPKAGKPLHGEATGDPAFEPASRPTGGGSRA
jgi:hypothetical protein